MMEVKQIDDDEKSLQQCLCLCRCIWEKICPQAFLPETFCNMVNIVKCCNLITQVWEKLISQQ